MPSTPNNRFLVPLIIASQFAPPFMFSGVAVAIPSMGHELSARALDLVLVETLFLAGSLALLLPIGRFADATDKNTLYKLGLFGFGLSSILIGLLSWMPAILVIRFFQGVASAVFAATGPAILADIVPAERRGRAYGSSVGVIYAGLTLGPLVAGYLVEHGGWRAVFFAGAGALLVMGAAISVSLPSKWRRPIEPVHLPSTLLSILAIACLVSSNMFGRPGVWTVALLGASLLIGAVFVVLQVRLGRNGDAGARPLLNIGALVGNRPLSSALLVQMLIYMNGYCSIFMLSVYMQVSLGHPAKSAGKVIAIGSVIMTIASPIAGWLSDHVRAGLIAAVGVGCVTVSTLLGRTLGAETPLWFVVVMLSIQGLGYALFSSPNMTTIMSSVPAGATGIASALSAAARSLGMVLGILLTGLLLSLRIGNAEAAEHPVEFIETMTTVFTILAVMAALALMMSIASMRYRPMRTTARGFEVTIVE